MYSCYVTTDAAKMLSKQSTSVGGNKLSFQPNQPSPSTLGPPSTQQNRSTEKHELATGRQKWDLRTIEVTHFKPDTSKEEFVRCFQDKDLCPCCGEVEDVDTSEQSSGIVYVKFTKSGGSVFIHTLTTLYRFRDYLAIWL